MRTIVRYLACFLLIPSLLFCEEDPTEDNGVADFEGTPSTTIAGCVNAITGDFFDQQIDLAIEGQEKLLFVRSYCSSDNTEGSLGQAWHHNHAGKLIITRHKQGEEHNQATASGLHRAQLRGRSGARMLYEGKFKGNEIKPLVVSKKTLRNGLTNTGQGVLSGQTNIKNESLTFKSYRDEVLHLDGTGTCSYYRPPLIGAKHQLLSWVVQPNGHFYHYHYDSTHRLEKFLLTNRSGTITAEAHFRRPSKSSFKEHPLLQVKSDDGLTLQYDYEKRKANGHKAYFIRHVTRPSAPNESYDYEEYQNGYAGLCSRVVEKKRPAGRYQKIQYYSLGRNQVGQNEINIKRLYDPLLGRVAALQSPVGTTADPVITHLFHYDLDTKGENGRTDVIDSGGYQTTYRFSARSIASIEYRHCHPQNSIYSIERFHWGDSHGVNYTNLVAHTYEDSSGTPFLCHHYQYDNKGNVVAETLAGNLTGNNSAPLRLQADARPQENDCERYVKRCRYSNDTYNLKIEEDDGRKITSYSYLPESNLIDCELVRVEGKICERTFYEYDGNRFLLRKLIDDGSSPDPNDLSGVTHRSITQQAPTLSKPYGLPAEVQERCWDPDSGEELLLSRVVNHYSLIGHLCKQDHYDSDNTFLYSLEWEYDLHGNLLREVNALGETIIRCYDENDNLIQEHGPQPGFWKQFTYDYSNRLICKELFLPNKERLATQYTYNTLSQLVEERDCYGNTIAYSYDHLGRKIKTTYPSTAFSIQPYETIEYDLLGNSIREKDCNGNIKEAAFTIRKKPYRITHPDGSEERQSYTLDGLLEEQVAGDGSTIRIAYDYNKRPIEAALYAPDGTLLSRTSRTYSAFHLLSETDNGGYTTYYRYDPAGRLIHLLRGDKEVHYSYDSRGNQSTTNENGLVITHKEYDLLNRPISECLESGDGRSQSRVEYRYDSNGNRTHLIKYNGQGASINTTIYDPLNRIIEQSDPEGNKSYARYFAHWQNRLGQSVAAKETTDPKGITTLTISDALGRDSQIEKRDPFGQLIQRVEFERDGNGNLLQRIDEKICNGQAIEQQVTLFSYDSRNRAVAVLQASGTKEEKKHRYIYDIMGRKVCTHQPDGTQLNYDYDYQGRQQRLYSSDGTIDYQYSYDALNNPVAVHDSNSGQATLRRYDQNSRLIEEILASGQTLLYQRDPLGRIVEVVYPDGTKLRNAYCGNQLTQVAKLGADGNEAYSHSYRSYDLSGNLTHEECIGSVGGIHYSYDLTGRLRTIRSSSWNETLEEIDSTGNLLSLNISDPLCTETTSYSYDHLSQLLKEEGSNSQTYGYDSLYNRTCKNGSPSSHNALNQIVETQNCLYSYDRNGNLSKVKECQSESCYSYDPLGRLTAVVSGSKKTCYTYDPYNRRLTKSTYIEEQRTAFESYLYQEQNEIAQFDDEGHCAAFRLLGNGLGAEIGAAVALELDGHLFAPIHDHNGNLAVLVDAASGRGVQYYRYSAYGEEKLYSAEGALLEAADALSPWRFSSKRVDAESGWIFFGRRHYSPALGRWITPDPAGYIDGPNLYAYVHNNPLTHFDLYGLFDNESKDQGRWTYCRSYGWCSLRSAIGYVGRAVELTAHHALLHSKDRVIGMPRTVLKGMGRFMQGKSFIDPDDQYDFYACLIPGRPTNGMIYFTSAGIMTNKAGIESFGRVVSEKADNATVIATGRPSKGLLSDGLDCLQQRLGFIPNGVRLRAECIRMVYQAFKERYSHVLILDISHSRGVIDAYNSGKLFNAKIRNNTYVNTIGGGQMFPEGDYMGAYNYINDCDSICLTDFTSFNKAGVNVIWTGYKGSGCLRRVTSHFIENYEEALNTIIFDCRLMERNGGLIER